MCVESNVKFEKTGNPAMRICCKIIGHSRAQIIHPTRLAKNANGNPSLECNNCQVKISGIGLDQVKAIHQAVTVSAAHRNNFLANRYSFVFDGIDLINSYNIGTMNAHKLVRRQLGFDGLHCRVTNIFFFFGDKCDIVSKGLHPH